MRSASAKSFAALACGALRDQRLDRGVVERGAGLQKGRRVALQQAQHAAQRLQQAGQLGRLRAVDFAGQVEQHGHRLGRAEVLVHRGLEARGMRLRPVDRPHAAGVHQIAAPCTGA